MTGIHLGIFRISGAPDVTYDETRRLETRTHATTHLRLMAGHLAFWNNNLLYYTLVFKLPNVSVTLFFLINSPNDIMPCGLFLHYMSGDP